jgi:hypothetical protein
MFTLLFREPVDAESLKAIMQEAGLLGSRRFGAHFSQAPYSQKLDRRFVSADFDAGRSSLTILVEPQPSQASGAAWGPDGWARVLLKGIRGVRKHLVGVVVHGAGDVVFDIETFNRRSGDVDSNDTRAFTAFFDLGVDHGRKVLSSYGMKALGLPEVFTQLANLEDDVEYERAQEAIMFVCNRLSWDARSMPDGTVLDIPVGLEVGSAPIEQDNPNMQDGPAVRWTVHADNQGLKLTRDSALIDPAKLWTAAGPKPLSYIAYRHLYFGRLEKELGLVKVAEKYFYRQRSPIPINEVRVYRNQAGHYLLSTCGYGRLLQPGGTEAAGSAHIELALELSDHHPQIANAISMMGFGLHSKSPGEVPIKPGDRLRLEILGFDRFLLLPMRTLRLSNDGPSVELVSPLPLTPDEYKAISDSRTFDPKDYDQAVRDRWLGAIGKQL